MKIIGNYLVTYFSVSCILCKCKRHDYARRSRVNVLSKLKVQDIHYNKVNFALIHKPFVEIIYNKLYRYNILKMLSSIGATKFSGSILPPMASRFKIASLFYLA